MKQLMKVGGIGCGGILGLIILIGIISTATGNGNRSATPTAVEAAAAPTATVGRATAAVVLATATPVPPTATPVPPSPTMAMQIGRVGQRIVSSGIALTVNSVQRMDQMNAGDDMTLKPTEPGHEYVVVDVTVENVERDKAPYNPLYFKVKDSDGYECNTSLSIDPQALKSGELSRGEKARGTVAFSVPKGRKGLVLSYQPIVILGDYQVIRVALD